MMIDLILKYLSSKQEIKIPGFGIFHKKDSPAFYDEKSAALLPPGKELFFEVDFNLKDENFTQFLSQQKSLSLPESQSKIVELTNYWKSTLENKKELEIPELGIFYVNDTNLVFKGNRFNTENPDNFGLEEVNLTELKNNPKDFNSPKTSDYKKSKNKLWWLFFIIPTAVIVYYATQSPELIFGKKSFHDLNKVKTNKTVKKDSLKKATLKTDSISLKNKTNAQK